MNRLVQSKKRVDAELGSSVRGKPASLYDAAYHLIKHGGKRLRPHLVLTCAQMLGGKKHTAIHAAASLEMIHNFSLVHDDIMDNDPVRHGVKTVHKKFGEPVAILAGDVLFSKAFAKVLKTRANDSTRAKMTEVLANACIDICEGQIMDIEMAAARKFPTRAQYITMVNKKTAALFEASCVMGALSAGASKRDVANVAKFGKNMGIAFQITDDIMGAMGDPKVTKKPVGNDLREGKKSLPILYALQRARGNNKKIIRSCFGNKGANSKALARAVIAMKKSGAENAAREAASRYAAGAKKALSLYSNAHANELIGILDSVVKRSM